MSCQGAPRRGCSVTLSRALPSSSCTASGSVARAAQPVSLAHAHNSTRLCDSVRQATFQVQRRSRDFGGSPEHSCLVRGDCCPPGKGCTGSFQDADAQAHNQMHPAPGLVFSDRPEGCVLSCSDPSVTQTVPTVLRLRVGMAVQGPPLRACQHLHATRL